MAAYIQGIWGLRYFWMSLVRMDVRSRYKGSVLGIGWSLLHPIAMTVILTVVFGKLLDQNTSFYAPFVMSGIGLWSFLHGCAASGCQCFFQGEAYIRQVPAPLAIYPLRTVLGLGFHYCLALLLVILLTVCVNTTPSILALLSLLPTLVLLVVFGWSLAVLFGLATVHFRDTSHLTEVSLQGLYFLTPIMYEPKIFSDKGLGFIVHCNPIVPFLDLVRTPILEGSPPAATSYALAAGIALIALGLAAWALSKKERKLIFHL